MSLDILGISPALLTIALIYIGIILILFFCFIFLGIKAFALGGTFGSVVNSLMPMAAGAGADGGSKDKESATNDDKVKGSVSKSKDIIQSNMNWRF